MLLCSNAFFVVPPGFRFEAFFCRRRHQPRRPPLALNGSFVNFLTECIFWTSPSSTAHAPPSRYNWRMDNATSNASSSAGFLADIFRLIPRSKRAAFGEMLAYELRGRVLSDHEVRRIAERAWHRF